MFVPVAPVVGTMVGPVVGVIAPTVGVTPAFVVGLVAGAAVAPVPKVALIATPLASVATVIGSGVFNKPTQFSPFGP